MIMNGAYKTEVEAEIAAKLYARLQGSIPFDGWNCNEYRDEDEIECTGWDGESRRCDCDNRRVYWYISKNADGLYSAEASAY